MYADGGSIGNPGPGGYGVVLLYNGHRKELSEGFRLTTNNRMELMAVIAGLEALRRPSLVTVYTDSRYVVDAISKGWAERWRAQGWMRSKREKALNSDLWERLLRLCELHQVEFRWVPGHSGHRKHERCHWLAQQAAQAPDLPADEGYGKQLGLTF